MKRSSSLAVEQRLETLGRLGDEPDRGVRSSRLAQALADRSFRVVAQAAELCEEFSLKERVPDLVAAFARFLEDPVKRDPKCIAKQAIARALVSLECNDVEFFLTGLRYRQPEPVWGGSADAAVEVRCSCAMGLVATGYWRALIAVAELLADPEFRAREGAARAIACGNPQAAEALLRFKVLSGDPEPEVIGECLNGLLSVAPEESLEFVAARLDDRNDAIRDLAALALGQSRHPGAVPHLRAAWERVLVSKEFRDVLIRAAAVHRSEAAFDWLISIIESGADSHAATAVDALSVYERNAKLAERVKAALRARQQASLPSAGLPPG